MNEYKIKDTSIFKFKILEPFHEIRQFVTSRTGGFSIGTFESLNLGFGTDDNPETVLKNRYKLSELSGIPLDWFVFANQTHSFNIAVVNHSQRGSGAFARDNAILNTDALITSGKNICIVVQVADCVPLLFFDSSNIVIAAVHAGWRGTLQEIALHTIEKMKREFNTNAGDIIACIGPSIGPCCYETGTEVMQKFVEKDKSSSELFNHANNKIYFDLRQANKIQLLQAGIKENNIEDAGICTKCNNEMFFSSRAGKGNTGRFLAGIMLQ